MRVTNRSYKLLFLVLAGFTVAIQVSSILPKSLTTDEPIHWRYGYDIMIRGSSDRHRNAPMPVSALNALPYKIGSKLPPGGTRDFLCDVKTGRFVTIIFSLLVGFYVFKWSSKLYGIGAGLFSFALYALSPNIIAHSRLITSDIYGLGMTLIALYHFWQFANRGGWKNAIVSATTVALSLLAKYTNIFLIPMFAVILLIMYSEELPGYIRKPGSQRSLRHLRAVSKYTVLFLLMSILIINAGFLFNRTMTPLGEYEWKGEKARAFRARQTFLNKVPVPLPYPYLYGAEWANHMLQTGSGFGNIYLLGRLRETGVFKSYYLLAFLFKVPIAVQALMVLAVIHYVRKRSDFRFRRDEVFLVVPIVGFTIYLSFFFAMQIGFRHLLIVFPLLYVFCGNLFKAGLRISRRLKILSGALLAYLLVSVLSYHPHYISYFNEMVWDRKMAYRYLADSNIDWGQNRPYLEDYLRQHPEAAYLHQGSRGKTAAGEPRPDTDPAGLPDSGLVVIRVNDLVGIRNPERFKWVRENLKPVDHIAYSYLIFEIDPRDRHRPR
jgi:predicted cobalt transporter CbtA